MRHPAAGLAPQDGAIILRLVLRLGPAGAVIAAAIVGPSPALADAIASSDGSTTPPVEPGVDYVLLLAAAFGLAVIGLGAAAVLRPEKRRLIAAGVVGGLGLLMGSFFVIVGLFFADWSGQHRISWLAVALGVMVLIGGVRAAAGAARGRRSPRS